MKTRYAYALLISLMSTPVAAQTQGRGPAVPGPAGAGPAGPGVVSPAPLGSGLPGVSVQRPMLDPSGLKLLGPLTAPSVDLQIIHAAPLVEPKLLAGGTAFEFAQERERDREAERREREAERRERDEERESELFARGWDAMSDSQYDRALSYFDRVADMKSGRLEQALYWKAYAQNRLGQRAEALTTIAELVKSHPTGRYRKQASVLEVEVRRDLGQPVRPQESADDEVKLMALQALQNTAPEEAIPMLEKVLEGTSSPKVKQRALFVLAQSRSPRAREVLRNYAKGSSTPELQSQAIQYLGIHGGPESRAVLAEVYTATTDVDVKRRILRAFMVSGERDRLLKAAQGEQNPQLRAEAVSQLGKMQAHEELWQLYQKENSVDVKRRIIRSMQVGGSIDRLIELAKSEQNADLRREVIRALGLTRAARTGDVLVQLYTSDSNIDARQSVIHALFLQENATALVSLARKEQDINLRKDLVSRLSQMRSKVATEYMLELLGK